MPMRRMLGTILLAAVLGLVTPGLMPSLSLADSGGVLMALPYDWTGEGNNGDWDNEDNWDAGGFCNPCYPNTTFDDATIAEAATVCLTTLTIDDLTVSRSVTFDDCDGTDPTLTVDTLSFVGPGSGTVVIRLQNGVEIQGDNN